jgi:hypothetical protein
LCPPRLEAASTNFWGGPRIGDVKENGIHPFSPPCPPKGGSRSIVQRTAQVATIDPSGRLRKICLLTSDASCVRYVVKCKVGFGMTRVFVIDRIRVLTQAIAAVESGTAPRPAIINERHKKDVVLRYSAELELMKETLRELAIG